MITTKEKVKELKRELRMREDVFPKWVLQGRIRDDVAQKRIDILKEILKDYEQKLTEEDKQCTLF